MSLHKLARLTGFIFIIIGFLGFIPGITEDGLFLGIFQVNAPHNFFHILTGLIAFGMSRKDQKITRYFFQILGVVYMTLSLLGFSQASTSFFEWMVNNEADNWLYLAVSIAFLYIGFLYQNHRYKK
jgi:hypothetical protein